MRKKAVIVMLQEIRIPRGSKFRVQRGFRRKYPEYECYFAKYLSLYLHIFTCTYRGTHTHAHMYTQHTRGMETTRHRSLLERGGRKALLETLHTHQKKMSERNRYSRIRKKRFEHIELPAKLLDYFLRLSDWT